MRTVLACLILMAATTSSLADGRIFEVAFPPSDKPDELVYLVTYRVWIPDGVKKLRAVIVHQHGCGKGACTGGMTAADDLHWQALAKKWNCALLGPSYGQEDGQDCRAWCDPRRGSAKAFLRGLDELSTISQHSELKDIPWCLWGHSGGGFWSSIMHSLYPERIVAIWFRSGSAYTVWNRDEIPRPTFSDAMFQVPMMGNPGAKEKDDTRFKGGWDGPWDTFQGYRAKGAPIGFAPDPRTSHECGDSRYLAIPFFDACLGLRLPPEDSQDMSLRIIDQSHGWLGDLADFKVYSADQYPGDQQSACWLPNEQFAHYWHAYVREGSVPDTTPPPSPNHVLSSTNDAGEVVISWDAQADFESGIRGFLILRDGVKIGSVPETPTGRFGRPLFQVMSYHDTPEAPLPKMEFVDKEKPANGKPSYQVITINSVELQSEPATAAPATK